MSVSIHEARNLIACTPHAAVYFDGVVNPADWSLTTIINATRADSTAQGVQNPSGGNPTSFPHIGHQLLVGPRFSGAVFSMHLNNNAFCNPSTQGGITCIDYSKDSINFVPDTIVPGNGQGSGVILQNGNFYRQQNPILVMPYSEYSSWTAHPVPGLVAADFALVTNAGVVMAGNKPDFSLFGSTMQLGFHRGNSGNGGYNTECGIDN